MGRSQNRKGGRKRTRQDETWMADARDVSTLSNEAFNHYYKNNVVKEEEWEVFMETVMRALPVAFRVHPSMPSSGNVFEYLHSRLSSLLPTKIISFVPNRVALQSVLSRSDIKRNVELKDLKKVMTALNEGGYITRQETVSMLPPVLLQVGPGKTVLDMCAAPGSKSSQLLEALFSFMDDGVLVANDINASRIDVLLHNTGRSFGAHSRLVVTNYDATQFPLLPPEKKFDRVLCDVMCSGDGTLRKSLDMWQRWNTLNGAGLHSVQIRVLSRGMMLCKKGGLIVYSTCSLNPVENEAVVSECLARAKGAFRLVDPTSLVPGLIAAEGLTDWSLLTKDLSRRLHTMEEAKTESGFSYRASMFPNKERLQEQNIHYTRRVLPHFQDTGGFFFALMECVDDYPLAATTTSSAVLRTELFKPLSPALQKTVRDALNLPESFPFEQLIVRSETAREQKLYFANKMVRSIFPELGPRVVQVGCKVFESYVKCANDKLRFCADGVGVLAHILPPSFVVDIDPELLLKLNNCHLEETKLPSLPQSRSFLLKCHMTLVGVVYIVAERLSSGNIAAKIMEWHVILAKLTLGHSLVDCNTEETAASTCAGEGGGAD